GSTSPSVEVRIFKIIVPLHQRAVIGITAHQLDRFSDNIHRLRTRQRDAVLRLQPKDASHLIPALLIVLQYPSPSIFHTDGHKVHNRVLPRQADCWQPRGVRPYSWEAVSFPYNLESPSL